MARGSGSSKARDKSHVSVLKKDSTTYASNGNEESVVHGESMSFGSEVTSLVHNQDDLNHFSADVQFGSGKETLLSNDDTFHVTTTNAGQIDNVVSDSGRNSTPKSLDLERIEVTRDNMADLFGVLLTSIKDIDDLTMSMEAGDCDDVLADMSNLADANVDIGFVPNSDTPTVQSVSIPKPVSYAREAGASGALSAIPKKVINEVNTHFEDTLYGYFLVKGLHSRLWNTMKGLDDVLENGLWMIQNSPLTLKKWTMNTRLFKEELTRIPVWVKLHDVSMKVFLKDEISLIATQIGKPIMIDSFASLMCIDSSGQSSFAHCLIEVRVDVALKDSVTMGIPLPDGEGFTKEMVHVDYEWKPLFCDHCKIFGHVYYQCPKNVTGISTIDKMKNDGFQMKVSYQPKAHGNLPENSVPKVSSSAKDAPSKKLPTSKGGFHVPISKPSVPTSNPYDVLDDMKSDDWLK
ncbi:zinc knuckle CX2CX4HX4C containing protein [Tanacetum coccineum]